MDGPRWRVYSAAELLARPGADPASFPPPLGALRAAYDSDTVAMVLWGFWVTPAATTNTLPLYRLDLRTLVWSAIPMAPGSVTPQTATIDDYPTLDYWHGHGAVILYFPNQRQLLVADLATGLWTAPPNAQLSAPDVVSYGASAPLLTPGGGGAFEFLVFHGGFFAPTLASNAYFLDLNTFLWFLPYDAQVRQRGVAGCGWMGRPSRPFLTQSTTHLISSASATAFCCSRSAR